MSGADEFSESEKQALLSSTRELFLGSVAAPGSPSAERESFAMLDKLRSAFDRVREPEKASAAESFPEFPGFTLLERLGSGGFASVFRARDETLHREVALKVLHGRVGEEPRSRAAARESFLHEARALAGLRHEGIVAIHSVIEHAGRQALVMELVDGEPLDAIVERDGPLSAGETAVVGAAIARALAAVHGRGLVHRDVKPGNVLRRRGGQCLLSDFGLGVFLAATAKDDSGTRTISGTPLFMAPEQARGEGVDVRSDLYSLGATLYFLSSGAYPCDVGAEESVGALLDRVREGRLVPLLDRRPDLPRAFIRVVEKALSLDPAQRFQSAGEMERGLAEFLEGKGAVAVRSTRSRSRRQLAALAFLAAAVLCIGAFLLFPRGEAGFAVDRAALVGLTRGKEVGDGESLVPGEEMCLELNVPRDAYVYVLNADTSGVVRMLFPHPLSRVRNPVPSGRAHRLPSLEGEKGRIHQWQVATPRGGKDWIYVVAAREPWKEFEDAASALTAQSAPPEIAAESLRPLFRSVEIGPGREEKLPPPKDLMDQMLEARSGPSEAAQKLREKFWMRRFELGNP